MARFLVLLTFLVGLGSLTALTVPEIKNYSPAIDSDYDPLSAKCDDIAHKFEKEYLSFVKTGVESNLLKELSKKLAKSYTRNILIDEIEDLSLGDHVFLCTTCRATTRILIRMFRGDGEMAGLEDGALKATMIDLCNRFVIQTKETCEGVVNIYFPTAKFLIKQSKIDSRTFCGTFLHASFCKINDEQFNWKLTIDSNGTLIEGPKKDIPPKGKRDLSIVHVTDIHYDPLYEAGSLAECDEVLCCQLHKNISQNTDKAAGFWGDYRNCDLPWRTVTESFKQIKKNHQKIDFVYQTGDIVDHASWLGSRDRNIASIKKVYEELQATFRNIPVYPTIGNHDSHPAHSFTPSSIVDEELNIQWLYDLHADLWSRWLPSSTQETIKKGGYYTLSPRKGFRIIAMNNNDCYSLNFWTLYNGTYPSEHLQWLHDTLLEAEKNAENVHILAHVPSGISSCWNVWSREFTRIVERFAKTISGIFNGHSHFDELSVYYSNKTIPVNVAWNGGSLTTYNSKNPNYKVYQVEPESFQVVDQETWFFNLTKANMNPNESPLWELEYKMSEEFNMTDMSPASVDELLTSFAETPSLLRKYWCLFVVKSDAMARKGCNSESLKNLICRLARSDNTDSERCEVLQSKLQEKLDDEEVDGAVGTCECGVDGNAAAGLPVALQVTSMILIYIGSLFVF